MANNLYKGQQWLFKKSGVGFREWGWLSVAIAAMLIIGGKWGYGGVPHQT